MTYCLPKKVKKILMYGKAIVLFSFSLLLCNKVFSQSAFEKNFADYVKYLSPEKLYVHTDRDIYCIGDTVWFKAYVQNAAYGSEYVESNYIYVELFNSQWTKNVSNNKYEQKNILADRKKIKRVNGIFSGYLVVPEEFSTSKCLIRAYTYWMMNGKPEYMFTKELNVTNPMKDKLFEEMKEKKINNDDDYGRLNLKNPFDKVTVKDKDYDVQFMPESGRYLEGIPSKIAIKVINEEGYGAAVQGGIYNSGNKLLAPFKTNEYGFGSVIISQTSADKNYYAVIEDTSGFKKTSPFPSFDDNGAVINCEMLPVSSNESMIRSTVRVSDNYLNDTLNVYIVNNSEIYYNAKIFNESQKVFLFKMSDFIPGINNIFILDKQNNIICERPFFVMPQNNNNISISLNRKEYKRRSPLTANIGITDSIGGPISANISVSVVDEQLSPLSYSNNIISEFLLKSELKGYIENPMQYFNDSISYGERVKNMDLLMLTHGWTYYELPQIIAGKVPMPIFGKEYIQTISGRVYGLFKNANKAIVSFLAPSINFRAVGQIDAGYFCLRDVDFPENTQFIVNAANMSGKGKLFTPILDEDYFAPAFDYPKGRKASAYSAKYGQAAIENYYNMGGGMVYELDPAIVTGRSVPKNSPSPISNIPFNKEEYRDESQLKQYEDWDLFSYVTSNFSGLRVEYSDSGKFLVGRVMPNSSQMSMGPRWAKACIYINNQLVQDDETWDLDNLSIRDIVSLAVVTGLRASAFQSTSNYIGSPAPVVMVRTKKTFTNEIPPNITAAKPIGWQKPAKFYSPRYSTNSRSIPDRRNTIYWNPDLNIENGTGSVSFYTSDNVNGYSFIIEGITDKGEYIFHKQTICENK